MLLKTDIGVDPGDWEIKDFLSEVMTCLRGVAKLPFEETSFNSFRCIINYSYACCTCKVVVRLLLF
jgi:hypothetical protein